MVTTDRARAAVARRTDQQPAAGKQSGGTLAQFIHDLQPEMARALPRGMNPDRMARIVLTEVRRTPALANCTRESFAGALLTAAQLGLEVGGPTGEAYLVPFKGEVTLIVGYQGYAKLFWQSPLAQHLDAQAVYAADFFEYEYGLHPKLVHRPAMVADRGPVVAFYAVGALSTGGSAFVVLSPEQVKELRSTSRRGDIRDPMLWMERKTALRQLFKLLPKSAELNAALAADEQVRTDLTENVVEASPYIDAEQPAAIEPPPANRDRGTAEQHVFAVLGDLGVTDRDDRLAVYSALLSRPVGSTKDLDGPELESIVAALDLVKAMPGEDRLAEVGGLITDGRAIRADGAR